LTNCKQLLLRQVRTRYTYATSNVKNNIINCTA
jgi:hypothetical protein